MTDTTCSFQTFSAANLKDGTGRPAIGGRGPDGDLTGNGPCTQGPETAQMLTVIARDASDLTGEDWFDDALDAPRFLGAPVTYACVQDGMVRIVTFPEGTPVRSEIATTMESGHVIRCIRLRHPDMGQWITAGYSVDPAPGDDGDPPEPGTAYGNEASWQDQGHRHVAARSAPSYFLANTRIGTPGGWRAVEDLRPGDAVATPDGAAALIWTGSVALAASDHQAGPGTWLVTLAAGCFGNLCSLSVSPRQRIAVAGPLVEISAGVPAVLVPVRALVVGGWPGAGLTRLSGPLRYFHLACADHRLIRVEGAMVETMVKPASMVPTAANLAGPPALPCLPLRTAAALVRRGVARGGLGPPGLARVPRNACAI